MPLITAMIPRLLTAKTRPKTLVLGNSHCQALKAATGAKQGTELLWVRSGKPGAPGDISEDEALARAATLGPRDRLVLMRLGTQHNVIGLLNTEPPLSILPGDGEAALIPRQQMADWIRDRIKRDRWLHHCAAAAPCAVFHAMPPPPKRDLSALTAPPRAYRGTSVADLGFAPAHRRLALWRLEQEVLAQHLEDWGITPLPVPQEALTPEGYLARAYWGPDATHANAAYGAALLRLCTARRMAA